jgi:hypothetical protein
MNEELNDVLSMDDFEAVSQMEMGQQEESTEQSLPGIDAGAETETAENTEPVKGNKLQERLDKITAEKYAEKRRADEEKRRADELTEKLAQMESGKPASLPDDLTEPEMPADIWDEEAMRKYHKDMAAYSRRVAVHEAKQVYSSTQQQQAQQSQQIEQQKVVQSFAKRAIDSGLTIEQVEQAGTALVNAGLSQELQMLLLEDEAGPQITIHLAKNPDLAFELIGMPLHKAAIKIATQVKAEAAGTKPRVSQAPDPIPSGRSASMKETDDLERQFKNSKFI